MNKKCIIWIVLLAIAVLVIAYLLIAQVDWNKEDATEATAAAEQAEEVVAETEAEATPAAEQTEEVVAETDAEEVVAEAEVVYEYEETLSSWYTADSTDYQVIPITMYMQAGYEQWEMHEGATMTVHAGEGYIDPFGVGTYTMGMDYSEQTEEFANGVYLSTWWEETFGGGGFCMYELEGGTIYAVDYMFGAIKENAEGEAVDGQEYNYGREDALVNVIIGGTGVFEGATGMLVGHTPSTGSQAEAGIMVLPQALFKFMEGYIKIPADPSTVTARVEDSDDDSTIEATTWDDDALCIEVNMTMKAGSSEYENHSSGRTIHAGIGYMYPFGYGGDSSYTAGMEYDEQADWGQPEDYFKQNFLDEYNTSLFCIYTVDGMGDMIVYDGLWTYMLEEDEETSGTEGSTANRQDALINVVVDGTGDFEDVAGVLVGKTMGAGEYSTVDCSWNEEYTLPSTLLKVMTGYIKINPTSGAYSYAEEGLYGFLN